jgi:benzoyl-CoA reductase/2-hydroxyglutaryl-CoA dehydratase subunit BcrC/BadD/HgdB
MNKRRSLAYGDDSAHVIALSVSSSAGDAPEPERPALSAREAYDRLVRAYHDRDSAARDWKARGKQMVGYLGDDVPVEVLIAADYLPVRVCGFPATDVTLAERYLERGFDPLICAQFARLLDGSYSYLDRLVIAHSSDALVRVYYYLRALQQVEPERSLPRITFFDVLHSRFRTSQLYNRARLRDLANEVAGWRGRTLTDEALRRAITLCNENRCLLRDLCSLRGPQALRLSGTQALQLLGAGQFLPREEHNNLLRAFLTGAQALPVIDGVRLFVTGSTHDHSGFYELIEDCGAVIVGEDHELGSALAGGEIDCTIDDPLNAIVEGYHLRRMPNPTRTTISMHVAALLEQVSLSGAQGVLCFIYESDDPPSWDFPELRNALEAQGIPVFLLDRQPYQPMQPDEFRAQVMAFVNTIQHRAVK